MTTLAPKICPRCEALESFAIYQDRMSCQRCGYTISHVEDASQPTADDAQSSHLLKNLEAFFDGEDASTAPPHSPDYIPIPELRPLYSIRYRGTIAPYARAAFNSGQAFIGQKRYEEAKDAFLRALELQRDFFDCYYWLAMLSTTRAERRHYLTKVIGYTANYPEALRELLLLDGKITEHEASVLSNPFIEPQQRRAGGAVATTTQNIRCPRCGSERMTIDDMTGLPYCDSCGYIEDRPRTPTGGTGGESSLFMALLKRRSQSVIWQVGERLILCNSCGADRTIANNRMSDYCPYCGSNHVILHDALGSFQQPDKLIPFVITRKQAGESIKAQLNTRLARMRRWVDNTAVARATLEGHFLPYWVFDATVQVNRTMILDDIDIDRRINSIHLNKRHVTESITDGMYGVLVSAVKSPPKMLMDKLGTYNLQMAIDYTPDLITKHSAQIYCIEFDRASLEARAIMGRAMRERYGTSLTGGGRIQTVSASPSDMQFQLVLMPVWVSTLYEKDGDIRIALVNGQNGTVVLGRSQKPPR